MTSKEEALIGGLCHQSVLTDSWCIRPSGHEGNHHDQTGNEVCHHHIETIWPCKECTTPMTKKTEPANTCAWNGHCFCMQVNVNTKPHMKCCNCGHQKHTPPPVPTAAGGWRPDGMVFGLPRTFFDFNDYTCRL